MYEKKCITCISHVLTKVNVCKKKRQKRNTTPVLDVKTLASQSTSRKVAFIGRAASGARVEGGEEWRDVACRGNQGRGNGGCRTCDDGSCVRDGNDYGNIVVGCVGKTNRWDGLTGFSSGRRRDRMSRDWW